MDKLKNRQLSEAENKALLKLIENRPCIWDKSCTKEPGDKKRAWMEICQCLEPTNFQEMDAEKQTTLEQFWAGKWTNLRDTFKKMVNKGSAERYRYYEDMKFLMKNLASDTTPTYVVQEPEMVENERNKVPSTKKIKIGSSPSRSRPMNLAGKQKRLNVIPKSVKPTSPPCLQEVKLQSSPAETNDARSTSRLHQKNNVLDEDEAFFISIMPSVKKLSDEDKLDFRMGVLSTIREISQKSRIENISSNSSFSGSFTQNEFPKF